MEKVNFFTAISFGDQPKSGTQSLLETVDSYFYLGGKKAYVIPGYTQQGIEGAVLTEDSPPFLITALKVISYLTVVLPVVMLIAKAVLRSIHTFHLIDPQQKLEEGINISPDTIKKIQALMPKITGREDTAEITWHASGNNLVFSLTSIPDLIFKMAPPKVGVLKQGRSLNAEQISEERFANMIKAQEVCLAQQLNLLVIPNAKKFNVDGMTLIAEKRVNINPNESAQEELYQLSGLNETARQSATFIAKTGFSDVEWRNMPILDTAPEFQGNRRIALIDLEEMDDAKIGIFGGGFGRRGLISCLGSEEQIDIALNEAQRHGIVSQEAVEIKAKRIEEIQSNKKLQQFYAQNNILENHRRPIRVDDLASLGLDLKEEGQIRTGKRIRTGTGLTYLRSFIDDGVGFEWEKETVTMEKAITDVISIINKGIRETPENASLKGKRTIRLDHRSEKEEENFLLKEYDLLGCPPGLTSWESSYDDPIKQRWLKRIINALVDKGHLFKLDEINAYGYHVQA